MTWTNDGADGDGDSVMMARFDAAGEPVIGILPEATSDTVSALEDVAHVFQASDFGFIDGDSDNLAYVVITELPDVGSLQFDGTDVVQGQRIPAASLSLLTWLSPQDANGAALARLKFKVTDSDRATSLDEYTLTFDVVSVNDAPDGSDKTIEIVEDTTYQFSIDDFTLEDVDGNSLEQIEVMIPTTGVLRLNGTVITGLETVAAADVENLTWTPDQDDFGQAAGAITFWVTDDGGTANGGENEDSTARTIYFDIEDTVDRITGTNGKDSLDGTDGSDIIRGRRGNDVLTGAVGQDVFLIENRNGKDRILDFDASATGDVLDIDVSGVSGWRDLRKHHLSERGVDAVIDFGGGHKVILVGVDIEDLDKTDFTI